MFWRVTEVKLSTRYGEAKSVGAVEISLMQKYTTVTKAYEDYRFRRNGFWKRMWTGETNTKENYTVPEKTEDNVRRVSYYNMLSDTSQEPKDMSGWAEHTYTGYSSGNTHKRYYKVTPATPENLLEAAIDTLKHYLDLQHAEALNEDRQRELDRILGDYPPKSLKDLVDA